jgi:hypothetical protein
MILVFDQLWFISRGSKTLAYLCHYEDNSAFNKRKRTGQNWAGKNAGDGMVIDNVPHRNFEIVDSVSRWSTSNKLIRVLDPRGFECEISTGNLVNILKTTRMVNGVILDECVWGREDGNNVLLPVNSEPYLEALKNVKEKAAPTVKFSTVKPGNSVVFKADMYGDKEYFYLGKGKVKYQSELTKQRDFWAKKSPEKKLVKYQDESYIHIFVDDKGYANTFKSTPKLKSVNDKITPDLENLRESVSGTLRDWSPPKDIVAEHLADSRDWRMGHGKSTEISWK